MGHHAVMVLALVWLAAAGQVVDAPEMGEGERQRQAKVLLDEALKRYEAREYESALESFKAAYALAPAPGLLFNMGQAYRLWGKGHCAEATRTYRAYLQSSPTAPNREKVEAHLKSLEACTREEEPAVADAPRPVELTPQPVVVAEPARDVAPVVGLEATRRPFRWGHLTAVLGGAAVLGVGAGLYAWAGQDYAGFVQTCGAGSCAPSVWQPSRVKEQIGVAMFGIGAVVIVAAAIWWLAIAGSDS